MAGPNLPDIQSLVAAGIDPKTRKPARVSQSCGAALKSGILKQLRILDEQNHVNTFEWHNLPEGLTGQLIERILYYKGQGMFFYMPTNKKFYFLPYALDGGIDVYGRYTGVTPLPFNGSASTNEGGKEKPWIIGLTRTPVYDVILDEITLNDIETKCVLLKDYTEQLSQKNIPRQQLMDPLLDVMSDQIPFMRTALLNGTGVRGMRVNDESEAPNVEIASAAINQAAIDGRKYVPIAGQLEFQDLTDGTIAKAEEYLLAMQSMDNYRLSLHGLDNGGLFQKKSHMLEAEQEMNAGHASLVLADKLMNRLMFCDIVNSLTGLGIWCTVKEEVLGVDRNGDGEASTNMPTSKAATPSNDSNEGGTEENV